jgi:hypothetical protein
MPVLLRTNIVFRLSSFHLALSPDQEWNARVLVVSTISLEVSL